MNSKIVGFILSKTTINYTPKINHNIKNIDVAIPKGQLTIFYYGDLAQCMIGKNSYSMGFPASADLLDHNLLITINKDRVIIENDWLGSIPLFYNTKDSIVSNFPKVCLQEDKSIDEEGLYYYLKYGFSVFEKTIFKRVKFLPFYSKIIFNTEGINTQSKEDPLLQVNNFKGSSEADIWDSISQYCSKKEKYVNGDIVIPTSAGFDSRIANYFINDRDRVKNYTYGISSNQEKSFEVQQAKIYSRKLGHHWEQIYLQKAFEYYEEWHDLYAFSTHLHGMYHIEFYHKIKHILGDTPVSMVSGICGGVFSGSNQYKKCTDPHELYKLAFTHGLNYQINTQTEHLRLEKEFMDRYCYMFNDIRLYPIITMRLKLSLLSYSINIPSIMGFPGWTPFLNFEIVMKMLNLPAERRRDRTWVKDFFASKNMLPHKNMFFQDTKNRLNFHLHNNYSFQPLSDDFNIPYLTNDRKNEINNYLGNINFTSKLNYQLTTTRLIKELLKKVGIKNKFSDFLTDYQTLKAIEMSM